MRQSFAGFVLQGIAESSYSDHMRAMAIFLPLAMPVWAEDWTTTSGTTYHDIKVLKIDGDFVTIQDADGEAMIQVSKLPPEIQKAISDDLADNVKRKEALQHPVNIVGTLIEKMSDGILVQCGASPALIEARNNLPEGTIPRDPNAVYGVCFLKNYSEADQLIDNAPIKTVAYPDGPYSYQTVDGSTATISSYTAQSQGP
jgi:hypothetical protein